MTIKTRGGQERVLPRPMHHTLVQLDRNRRMRLGLPVTKIMKHKPTWGYYTDPDDEGRMLPYEEDIKLLLEAWNHLRTGEYSFKSVADWLSEESHSGKITSNGLYKIMLTRAPLPEVGKLPIEEREKL